MVKRRYGRTALFTDEAFDLGLSVVLRATDDADLGAERPNGVYLVGRDQARHANDATHTLLAGGVSEPAPMIAGRSRGHAVATCIRWHRQQSIGCAAQLEAACGLAMFKLQED